MDQKNLNQKDVGNKNMDKQPMDQKKKKIITLSVAGGIALLVVILIVLIIAMSGKPSKGKAEELVKSYLTAVEDDDGDKFEKLVDPTGYIIYNEEGEKKFDKKYKDRKDYIEDYLDDKNYDDIDDAKDAIASSFEKKYYYDSYEYSLKEITSIKKKENKIIEIKAKVKYKSSYGSYSDNAVVKLYVLKVDGKYKIIGEEINK